MAKIRIEFVPVKVAHLGWFGLDHLQLVYQPNDFDPRLNQDDWFVIEGLRDNTGETLVLGVEGFDGKTTLVDANSGNSRAKLVEDIGTPLTRGSRIIDVADPENAWRTLAEYAEDIASQELPYIALGAPGWVMSTLNSSSVIASLLYYIDVDIANNWPTGVRFSPGWTTLIGTSNDDELAIVNGFTALVGGNGSDTLEGGDGTGIEKFFGGRDDDTIKWSPGRDTYHGGQARLAYAEDGTDTVDFSGVGRVIITGNSEYVEHKTPNYFATHSKGVDKLFSIERLEWDSASDVIVLDNGARLTREGEVFNFGEQSSAGAGDTFNLSSSADGLTVNFVSASELVVTRSAYAAEDAGLWLESLEWLISSGEDDKIYANAELRGVEAGDGNDLIDARAVAPFSGLSPQGFDIEIDGGAGNDTIVSGAGRTLVQGSDGADTFIVSTLTPAGAPGGRIEMVINDAGADDRLLVPYDLFNGSGGDLEGSPLMPVLGAIGKYSDMVSHGWTYDFSVQLESQRWYGHDFSQGIITFIGRINFALDGGDLLIRLYSGGTAQWTVPIDDAGHFVTYTVPFSDPTTETLVRVVDFQEGDLGIHFHDPGTASTVVLDDGRGALHWSNWDEATRTITNNGELLAPLDARPDAPTQRPGDASTLARQDGSDGADHLVLASAGSILGGGGDDDLTGSGGADMLDGGAGADTLRGGGGNDHYVVDSSGDVVIEGDAQGHDAVNSSVDYALGGNLEDLTLTGAATLGTGNALDNLLVGNDRDNLLDGGAGNDVLAGDLGSDTLTGGGGGDTYVYAAGDGDDVIIDAGAQAETDRLELTGIDPAGVSFLRLANAPGDLLIVLAEGGSLLVRNQTAADSGIDVIVFDDGTTWSRAEIDARLAAASLVTHRPPQASDDASILVASGDSVLPAAALVANDRAADGLTLSIVSVSNVSVGSASVTDTGDVALSLPPGTSGLLTLDYTVSDSAGGVSTAHAEITYVANGSPVVTGTLPDLTVTPGGTLAYTLPAGLFTDPDGDPLTIVARLADGGELPAWLIFDSAATTLAGTVPASASGTLYVELSATDGLSSARTILTLQLDTPQGVHLVGTSGADRLEGGAGPDLIVGGRGDDILIGGGGNDTFMATGNTGWDLYDGGGGTDSILGGSGNDLIGLAASAGNLAGIEVIDGGDGFDVLRGASGADTIDISHVTLRGIEIIRGLAGNDTIIGSAGSDTIEGGAGSDSLRGGAGDDVFLVSGGAGADCYDGGSGIDIILGSGADDNIALAATASLAGIEIIDGGDGFDVLRGTAAADSLDLSGIDLRNIEAIRTFGGDDTIKGSAGDDVIEGGGGCDLFVMRPGGHDIIADFQPYRGNHGVADRIDLRGWGFNNLGDVLAHASADADGTGTVISLDSHTSLTISHVLVTAFTASHFDL